MRMGRLLAILIFPYIACVASRGDDPKVADGGAQDLMAADLRPIAIEVFPSEPIIDTSGTPPPGIEGAPALFANASSGSAEAPCLTEPENDSLFPRNWLRPRVQFSTAGQVQNVFEIRIHVDGQANDLLVYTSNRSWTLSKDLWLKLSTHVVDRPIIVSVRGGTLAGGALSAVTATAAATITVAPVGAAGTIVYWYFNHTTGIMGFKGFNVGEDVVTTVAKSTDLDKNCVGCHVSTPDGKHFAFGRSATNSLGEYITIRSLDGTLAQPTYLSNAASSLLGRTRQRMTAFSAAHWSNGDRVALTTLPTADKKAELIWTDLEAAVDTADTAWGILPRTGDRNGAAHPAWTRDGRTVVYTSVPDAFQVDGADQGGKGDLYTVPYNNRRGGVAMPLIGAADASANEYFPAISPNDELVAYTRGPEMGSIVSNREAEIFLVPMSGGTSTRLKANDPPACTKIQSPGATNSWPKWSPEIATSGGKSYYWLIFSSRRFDGTTPQLYMTGLEAENTEQGPILRSHGAIYLWNQTPGENNHTPSWDVFDLPIP